ncbi:hypothetical protein [Ensifer adhaerens]|nr:hypothetical protein [Ensifer sp. ENS04]RAS05151.1 hypothetical protein DEU52_1244 [Ensifer adhaerens]SFH25509.1 hypothetical protein SAMN05216459_1224 [Ensifer sp. OV372]
MIVSNTIPADAVLVAMDIAKARNDVFIERLATSAVVGCRSSTCARNKIG